MNTLSAGGLLALLVWPLVLGAEPVPAPEKPDAAVTALAMELAPRLTKARYLEANPEKVTVPGWEGFPTVKCTYRLKDKATGMVKTAPVILLDPDATQLARWIVTASREAKGNADRTNTAKLTSHILAQSGGQFPVRGIVYEDILPANGIHEIYCFRDGVTVKINGVEHRGEQQPSAEAMKKSLTDGLADITWAGKYARIQSTTREDYRQAGGKEPTDGTAWLEVSRKAYQQAWGSDRNELMIAWAKAHL